MFYDSKDTIKTRKTYFVKGNRHDEKDISEKLLLCPYYDNLFIPRLVIPITGFLIFKHK